MLAACTSPDRPGSTASSLQAAGGAPAAWRLLASPGRLVDRPVASSGCGHRPAVRPGTTARLTVAVPPASAAGARSRVFWLHAPAHYTPGRPAPLILAFHGGNGSGPGMERDTGLSALADRDGLLVAYPQGLAQPQGHGSAGWDASGPRDPFAHGIDDGLYVSDLLNAVQAGYCVDPARIAVTGFSNGGSLAGYLACVLAGRIAAFAPVEGVFFQIPGGCHPAHPAAILDVHVLTDPVAPYAGVPSRGSPDYYALAIPAWLRAWALRDGCHQSQRALVTAAKIPGETWANCPAGVAVTGYRLASGGHSWFRDIGASAGDRLILSFFAAHPLRALTAPWRPATNAPGPLLTVRAPAIRSLRQFRVPTPGAEPFDIAADPSGSMWFTEFRADKIARITPSGVITEFGVPTAGAGPYQIVQGPGGSMWFTEYNTTKIGRITPSGQVTEIQLPRPTYGGTGLIAGPRGPVQAADPAGFVDQIPASGPITRIRLPARGFPFAITRSSSGDIWVSELTGFYEYSRILVHLPAGSGKAAFVTLPSPRSDIDSLAAGPAGSVWFADFGQGQLGEVDAHGHLRLFSDHVPYGGLSDIAEGPDGCMWFTEQAGLAGRLCPGGMISELALPTAGSNPDGIASGPGRTIWVTETGSDAIARIALP